ncbi:haloacid dehalogenase type II [Paraburkholderia nodosa]|uniref:haloacid dehalogenase type II n=1 Tax=Paraburkholderia nodosa TaxID=392320 RepID=UPI00047FC137|nr:haloacid dehalogenase type II [Paraburkholderia nodosa]
MIDFEPKYITFDCYGTLTKFRMADMARELYGDRLKGADLEKFVTFFAGYRLDEVLGAWKPYRDVVVNAVRRACKRMNVEFVESEAEKFYTAVPTWGPHPDVPEGLSRLAKKYKLVILSNASDDQIQSNVDKLGAPFHRVFTAQQAQSYKPRMQGFEYMFDQLNCNPGDVLHVSSSLRYDIMTAHDMGIKHKAFVKRGHEPGTPYYEYYEVETIGELASQLGL